MGPLQGIRVIELAGIGPGPFACMMLADHGAEVIRVQRPGIAPDPADVLQRSRRIVSIDLKSPDGIASLMALVRSADILVEGYRPGTIERLGIGPAVLHAARPDLVIGRMTGWGQDGPYAADAGHDINYIAISGALHAIGTRDRPIPPLSLIGDFGGGAMILAFGLLAALLKVRAGGPGQVVDCAMADGSALLMTMIYGMLSAGDWRDERAANLLDGAAPFYDVYKTADDKFVAIGAIEPQFYARLLDRLALSNDPLFSRQNDRENWPQMAARLRDVFRMRTRDQWCALLEHGDTCFAPVMSMAEAPSHPQMLARRAFVDVAGRMQPSPAPRYSATPLAAPRLPEAFQVPGPGDGSGNPQQACPTGLSPS